MAIEDEPSSERAGWKIVDWCNLVSISRAGFYGLEHPPRTVKIGKRHIVAESPKDYLTRRAGPPKENA